MAESEDSSGTAEDEGVPLDGSLQPSGRLAALRYFIERMQEARHIWDKQPFEGVKLSIEATLGLLNTLDAGGKQGLQKPLASLLRALTTFEMDLDEALKKWVSDHRDGAEEGVAAAFDLSHGLGIAQSASTLFSVRIAFADLKKGQTRPWMKPSGYGKGGAGSSRRSDEKRLHAYAVVILGELRKLNQSQQKAAEKIAKAMLAAGYPAKRGKTFFSADTVITWHEQRKQFASHIEIIHSAMAREEEAGNRPLNEEELLSFLQDIVLTSSFRTEA
jgi:hypothetical protein